MMQPWAKIDPAKPYQPGDNVAEYAKLKKQFDALSDDAKKVYREARDAYKNITVMCARQFRIVFCAQV